MSVNKWYRNCSFSSSQRKNADLLYWLLKIKVILVKQNCLNIYFLILKIYLNKEVLDNKVFKCLESNFFFKASLTQALAYPMWVLISVIAWTLRMSKMSDSGSGFKCSGPIDFLSPGDLWRSEVLVGETSFSKAKFDKSTRIVKKKRKIINQFF